MKKYQINMTKVEFESLLEYYKNPNISLKTNIIMICFGRVVAKFKYDIDNTGCLSIQYKLGILGWIRTLFFMIINIFIIWLLGLNLKTLLILSILIVLEFLPTYLFEYKLGLIQIEKVIHKINKKGDI